MELPPCGLYRTTDELAGVPEGRLVFFHNHGDPGPGIYLPDSWKNNRVTFATQGRVLDDPAAATTLEPVAREGLYRVEKTFTCCEKDCVTYSPGLVVQLGYNGNAHAILFVPRWSDDGFTIPSQGQPVDGTRIDMLSPLTVAGDKQPGSDMH